jgi:hypothetical protein
MAIGHGPSTDQLIMPEQVRDQKCSKTANDGLRTNHQHPEFHGYGTYNGTAEHQSQVYDGHGDTKNQDAVKRDAFFEIVRKK